MRARLFTNTNQSMLSVDFKKLREAVEKSDAESIDIILKLKKDGYELNLDEEINGVCGNTVLCIALKKGDIEIAAKLIRAGAKTTYTHKEWVPDDNSCYPYGDFETSERSVFASVNLSHDKMMTLMSLALENHTTEAAHVNQP